MSDPDVQVKTYRGKFLDVLPGLMRDVDQRSFTFFFIDPKGWRIDLRQLAPVLERGNSEVVFNFMFEFINRFAGAKDPVIAAGLDELIPVGDWRPALAEAEQSGRASPEERKRILVDAFRHALKQLGGFKYVAETTVLRPRADRPLYCLCYATRHTAGIEVFRDAQLKALHEESKVRAATKLKHAQTATGQSEIFESLHDMGPERLNSYLAEERACAEGTLVASVPPAPASILYGQVWPRVLEQHIVKHSAVNEITARLFRERRLLIPDWPSGGRVRAPKDEYRIQAPPNAEA